MRKSVGWLAAAALCLGAASGAHAQSLFQPFTSNGTPPKYTPFTANGNQIAQPFANAFGGTPRPPSGASQATFPSPGQALTGPARLMNLLPNLGRFSNTHPIGYSIFPTQTDQYLALFGYQKLR